MNDSKNLAIAVLSITATVLLVGVILGGLFTANEALAIGQTDRGGDYIMVTGQFTQNSELIFVTDAAAQRLNLYSYETSTRQFVLWDSLDLKSIFGTPKR